MKKVILLGGSNSIRKNGMCKFFKRNSELSSFALGASSSLQNLYELIRNKDRISQSDLIVSESNVNDFHNHNIIGTPISVIDKNIGRLYERLSSCGVKVIVLLLPLQTKKFKHADTINFIHIKYIEMYGLNYIDMHSFYKENQLCKFFYFDNLDHPLDGVMYQLAESILNKFDILNCTDQVNNDKKYSILTFSEVSGKEVKENSLFRESVFELSSNYKVPDNYIDKEIIGLHAWSDGNSVVKVKNREAKFIRGTNSEVQFHDFKDKFRIDQDTYISKGHDSERTEPSIRYPEKNTNIKCNPKIISFLLIDNKVKKYQPKKNSSICFNDCLDFLLAEKNTIEQYYQFKKSMGEFKKFISAHRGNVFIEALFRIKKWLL